MSLAGKTIFITGASRGIGEAIALRAAKEGANIVVAAKTAQPHPKLPGTIYTAAEKIERAGGKALPLVCDIRQEDQIIDAINKTVARFGGIDILVNNASAINLTGTAETSAKRFDLMHQVNARGTWLVSKVLCSTSFHEREWFENHTAYTMAKYGMSMCVLGMAGEFRSDGIAVNALWPATVIQTAALQMIEALDNSEKFRTPEIMADAAHIIFTKNSREFTGNFLIDELLLHRNGVTDFSKYSVKKGATEFDEDFFIDDDLQEEIYAVRAKCAKGSKL
ncbi:Hydroxysteroid dehydrogenase-like protein 2 [Entomophthora muscae]|uniref:Hydroxysteroid dehydrogenase-like protein 2 n=1 Tax=Entomophthora muscae TaxID=34485 RepID=A0ACC2TPT1_9FUNG|nr:Hydroxysteroid dehydrogenase-like protein 2 [Entomophthora muscae]